MNGVSFTHPWLLVLLPLALLPLLHRERDHDSHPCIALVPEDSMGIWLERLWRALAVIGIASLVMALVGPARSETRVEQIGRGAEIAILLDRSASMDTDIRLPPPVAGEPDRVQRSKNEVVRAALTRLVAQRPDNRYSFTLFNAVPMRVTPFTDDDTVIQAGLLASGIGRGPSKTDMGSALLAALETFAGRDYTGSRAIMLVSDGGARLEPEIQRQIARGLAAHRVALYFIYIRSSPNSPNLETVGANFDASLEEVALHDFFRHLDIDYQVYQADDPDSMDKALDQIDAQQNQPITTFRRVPRVDYRPAMLGVALITCLLLLGLASQQRRLIS